LHIGISCKKRFEVLNKRVLGIDAVEPVRGCLVYSIYKRNVPPWSAGLATRSVVGFVGAKILLLVESAKYFEGKLLL